MSETTKAQSASKKHKIFVIDDHPSTRMGLKVIINMESDMEVCGELDQARGAVDEVARLKPDAMLLDLRLKGYSGLELIKDLRAAGHRLPILVLSSADENFYSRRVLSAKGNGYLMKEEAPEHIIDGLRTVLRGDVYLSEGMVRQQINHMNGMSPPVPGDAAVDQLTDREFEVFELLGEGLPADSIAMRLGISPKTVHAHQTNIKEKLGLSKSRELVRHAIQWHASAKEK